MKNKFYIMTALVISLTGCSNIEDGTQPTGNFPEDHIIRVVTEVKAPVSRAGYDASNLESFGLSFITVKTLLMIIIRKW